MIQPRLGVFSEKYPSLSALAVASAGFCCAHWHAANCLDRHLQERGDKTAIMRKLGVNNRTQVALAAGQLAVDQASMPVLPDDASS